MDGEPTVSDERKIVAWSFSRLKTYEQCPYRLWLQAGERRETGHMDTTAADRGTMIHAEAENFVLGKGDFTKNLAKFAEYFQDVKLQYEAGDVTIEENWGFDADWQPTGWWDDDVRCRVKLDNFRITARNDEGEPVAGIPTDYKTGKKFGNEVGHNQQGQLYAISSFLKMSSLELVDVEFVYLDHGLKSKPKRYTREKAMKFLPPWQKRAQILLDDREFRPKANKITCRFCPFGPQNGNSTCAWGVDA
jgi:RecB family exonuclease